MRSCFPFLLAPLLIGIALAIRLTSPGPALFRQPRYGKDNVLFLIWKFRTMRPDAQDPSGRVQTVEGDSACYVYRPVLASDEPG